ASHSGGSPLADPEPLNAALHSHYGRGAVFLQKNIIFYLQDFPATHVSTLEDQKRKRAYDHF
ncbi:MAG TPA: hypothetical protein VGE41_06500, partial [Verrucomicrobiae bacterium]